ACYNSAPLAPARKRGRRIPVSDIQKKDQTMFAMAFGVGTHDSQEQWLEVFYPLPLYQPAAALVQAVSTVMRYEGGNQALVPDTAQVRKLEEELEGIDAAQAELLRKLSGSKRPLVVTLLERDEKPASVPEV